MSTFPLGSCVAVCLFLDVAMFPVVLNMPIGAAGLPNTALFELILPQRALMWLEPVFSTVAKPALSIDATAVLLEFQVSLPKVAIVLSVNLPVAANCCVNPTITLAEDGVMAMDANTGAVTVKVALLDETPLTEALMMVLPCANDEAIPLELILATLLLLDDHVAKSETLPELSSE
jgi:hypothetical protein